MTPTTREPKAIKADMMPIGIVDRSGEPPVAFIVLLDGGRSRSSRVMTGLARTEVVMRCAIKPDSK